MRVPLLLTVAAVGVPALAAPAAAPARTFTVGSDLKARAAVADSNPNDWAAWNRRLPGGRRVTVPRSGELNAVRIKGRALQRYAEPVSVRVVVLAKQGGGRRGARVTSNALPFPTSGSAQQITRFGREALNVEGARMCVKRGDVIAFFVNGGFEVRPGGVQARVFARAPRAATSVFKAGGALPPAFGSRTRKGRELLLQARIGTGRHARPACGGTGG